MRLIVAFIVVALLAALASSWFHTLIESYHLPAGLREVVMGPNWLRSVVHGYAGQSPPRPVHHTALVFFGAEAGLLLAVIATAAIAASTPVLRPVRRLARAAQRMAGGDLSVRIEPRGRDELAQLVTSFNGMAAALEDKVGELQQMEARARQFAGDVSHELRTPLTAMTAVTDILYEHPDLAGDAATAARLVHTEVLHLNRLVEDLIEISRFDAGTAQLVTDDTDVAAVVDRCLRTRGWTDVSAEVPAGLIVRLDRRRFDIILANLVGNALRHGALPVTVTAGLQADGHGGPRLTVDVRDHGDGLPPSAIPHLFDRFFKADTARARSEGSGLGLAIAWENARLHGGRIDAGNHQDGGAIFTVSLPGGGAELYGGGPRLRYGRGRAVNRNTSCYTECMANTRFSISTDPAIQKAIKAHAEAAGLDVSAYMVTAAIAQMAADDAASAVFTPLDAENASALAEAAEMSPAPLPALEDLTAEEQHLVLRVMRSALGSEGSGEAGVA